MKIKNTYSLLHAGFGNNLYQIAFTLKQNRKYYCDIPLISVKKEDVDVINFPQNLIYTINPKKDLCEFGGHPVNSKNNLPVHFKDVFPNLNVINDKNKLNKIFNNSNILIEQSPLNENQHDFFAGYSNLINTSTSGLNFINHGVYYNLRNFYSEIEHIRKKLEPSNTIKKYIEEKYQHIVDYSQTKVGIHLRFGYSVDNILNQIVKKEEILRIIEDYDEETLFVVCSDNIEKAKNLLENVNCKIIFIEDEPMYIDFFILLNMDDNILTMSTFSAWIALLNPNKNKKVFCPSEFVNLHGKGSLPSDWELY